jgi:hypothetical protein
MREVIWNSLDGPDRLSLLLVCVCVCPADSLCVKDGKLRGGEYFVCKIVNPPLTLNPITADVIL